MSDSTSGTSAAKEIRATFKSADMMQDAVSRLSTSGFDRADLSLPSPGLVAGTETPEAGSKPVDTESDARQGRTLGASTAAAAAALAAAGVTIATGGAAAPAVAAAVAAGGAAGGSIFAATGAANKSEQTDRDTRARSGDLVLAVRAATEAKRSKAEAVLREAGATSVEVIG